MTGQNAFNEALRWIQPKFPSNSCKNQLKIGYDLLNTKITYNFEFDLHLFTWG